MAEQWYAIHRIDNGELVSVGTVIADQLPPELSSKALAAQPDFRLVHWNKATLLFESILAPSDDELLKAQPIPVLANLAPTAAAGKPALLQFMKQQIFEAQAFDWFNTKAQADGALTAAQKTAVANLNTQLYQRARAAVAAWYQAV